MEGYLSYISDIVAATDDGYLQPVFGITLESDLAEREVPSLRGYNRMGPVRVGNDAYTQVQNDGYGSVILACAQSFFDQRLTKLGDATLLKRLERLGEQAIRRRNVPDAGLWELRTWQEVHTFSSLMCWAACDRLARICDRLAITDRRVYWQTHADRTLKMIEERLRKGPYLYRYHRPDDFGTPKTSFNICIFWYIDALAAVGRTTEARELFENMLACRNKMGLLSEDVDPNTRQLWGNFPQTYSMAGLIKSAMKLSKPWEIAF